MKIKILTSMALFVVPSVVLMGAIRKRQSC